MMMIIVFNICHHFHDDDGHRHNSALMAWAFRARCRLIKGLKTWCGHDTLYLHLAHCIVFVLFATGLRCLVMYMHSNMIFNVRYLYPPGLRFNVFSKYCIFPCEWMFAHIPSLHTLLENLLWYTHSVLSVYCLCCCAQWKVWWCKDKDHKGTTANTTLSCNLRHIVCQYPEPKTIWHPRPISKA